MTSTTAKALDIKLNFGHRKCMVNGSYIPSTLIGQGLAKELGLSQPLLPLIYAPSSRIGQFHLEIDLPEDIRDDGEGDIPIRHNSWGILISLSRRKTVNEGRINLTSCFGNTTLSRKPSTLLSPDPVRQVHIPPAITTPPPRTPKPSPTHPSTTPSKSLPESLIGKQVQLPDSKWGPEYNGQIYTGRIDTYTTDGQYGGNYVWWEIQFQDCRDKFDLDDLLKYLIITVDEYALLKSPWTSSF